MIDRKKVIIIKTNLLERDPRLAKEIEGLKRAGYTITLLCWNRDCKSFRPNNEESTPDHHEEIRVNIKAPWGIKVLPLFPIWWFFEFFWLMVTRWDVVHAINFDSIMPALIASKIKRKPIIYEMFDTYEDIIVLPWIVRSTCVFVDKICMYASNAVIVVDEARLKELDGIPNSNIVVIYNSPPDFSKGLNAQIPRVIDDKFTIFYAGVLYRNRRQNLDKVVAAIKSIDGVEFIIAGYGDQVEEIEKWAIDNLNKVRFIGKIDYSEVLKRTMAADLLIALYEPVTLNLKYTSANKIFEAMLCGKPILVSKDTTMAEIIEKENCGIAVDCNSIGELKKVIIRLKNDKELCKELGANGRKAYEQKYNWEFMEQKLLSCYSQIINKHR